MQNLESGNKQTDWCWDEIVERPSQGIPSTASGSENLTYMVPAPGEPWESRRPRGFRRH